MLDSGFEFGFGLIEFVLELPFEFEFGFEIRFDLIAILLEHLFEFEFGLDLIEFGLIEFVLATVLVLVFDLIVFVCKFFVNYEKIII